MASMPSRIKSLEESVDSILPQCDELHIYLNNYDAIPAFLNHPKIKAYLGNENFGDLGDVGKFFKCDTWSDAYIFTVDDDIIYPFDYAAKIIGYIERYQRKIVVTANGRIINQTPVKNYYIDPAIKYFSCFESLPSDQWINCGGTGVTAFHTDILKPELAWFKTSNMSDIWFYLKLQELKIPVLLIKHHARWLRMSNKYSMEQSIYNSCKLNCKPQTSAVNAVNWKVFTPSDVVLTKNVHNRPKILVKYPTRGRSAQFFETLVKMISLAADPSNLRFIITCDKDDKQMNNKEVLEKLQQFSNLEVFFGNNKTKIEACNADISGDFDIIMLASDDMKPVLNGWDDTIRDQMLKNYPSFDGYLWFYDGYQAKICTLPILGKKEYDRLGYIYYPGYKSFFCDDEQTLVAKKLNKIKYIDTILFRHNHPIWTGAKRDKTYQKNAIHFETDKKQFTQRRSLIRSLSEVEMTSKHLNTKSLKSKSLKT